jgi:hypothetical protein
VYGIDINADGSHQFGQICSTIDVGRLTPFILIPNK